eukprot:CAMPEP_0197937696 /NCGR_PEP_ID=MMETSP1439-20131203/116938_1 /TAXON_ID=66791 /ORGANISM="Gonyaulax spinifera, Strain CCMP409" /LENGTH=298 /DNA_ID=CAMNT_0043560729 /DNA_START=78 /DNA_END=974 /DNA_ORIENTATION=+
MGAAAMHASCATCCGDGASSGDGTSRWPSPWGADSDFIVQGCMDPLSEFTGLSRAPDETATSSARGQSQRESPRPSPRCGDKGADGALPVEVPGIAGGSAGEAQPPAPGAPAPPQSSRASSSGDERQRKKMVERFVKGLVKGLRVSVLSVNGDLVDCLVSIDREITTISLQRASAKSAKKRGIPLGQILKVCTGKEGLEDLELPVDELCATVLLADGQTVSFSFEDIQDRDTFAKCLSIFIEGQRARLKQKQQGKADREAAGKIADEIVGFGLEDPDNLTAPICQGSPEPFELPLTRA